MPRGHKFLRGRHGDIKQPNILWFVDPSTRENRLVLSDFTLMRFHAQGSNTDTLVHSVGRTRTYRAPELDVPSPPGTCRISPKYDVWSLGCVFLEYISCHLVGYEATRGSMTCFEGDAGQFYQTFSTTRILEESTAGGATSEDKYFIYKWREQGHAAQVKESVKNWFSYLRGLEHCPNALRHFLDLIEKHMLVIKPGERWGARRVLSRLKEILDQKAHPEGYYLPGRSRGSFHPSPLLRPWDESLNDQHSLGYLNTQTQELTWSSLSSREGPKMPGPHDFTKHDMHVLDATFLPGPSNSVLYRPGSPDLDA